MGQNICILVGEASGDIAGATLAHALRRLAPDVALWGFGGYRMAQAGVRLVEDTTHMGFIGAWEALTKIPAMLRVKRICERALLAERPAAIVLIDSPGLNLRVARFARAHDLRTVYYFPPSAWTNELDRARRIAGAVDRIVPAFEHTADVYRRAGVRVDYFGHPLVDWLARQPDEAGVLASLGVPADRPTVGLLPGSRPQELRLLLGPMCAAADRLRTALPDVHFVVPLASPAYRRMVEAEVARWRLPITVLDGHAGAVMRAARLVIMSSGTAALEAAWAGTPMILLYKLSAPDWFLVKRLVKVPFAGLPNLMLGRQVVPELLQDQVTPERIVAEALDILSNEARRRRMCEDLSEVKRRLGSPGVVDQVARVVLETAGSRPSRTVPDTAAATG